MFLVIWGKVEVGQKFGFY